MKSRISMVWKANIRPFTPLRPRLLYSAALSGSEFGGCRGQDKAGAKRPYVVASRFMAKARSQGRSRQPNLQQPHDLTMDPSHTFHDGTASSQASRDHHIGDSDTNHQWRPFHGRWGHQIDDGTATPQAVSQPSNATPSSQRPRRSRRLKKAQKKQQAASDTPSLPQDPNTLFHSQNASAQVGYDSGSQIPPQFGNAFATAGGSNLLLFPPATEANHNTQYTFPLINFASGGGSQMMTGGQNTTSYLQNPFLPFQPFGPMMNPVFWTGNLPQRNFMSTMTTNPFGTVNDQTQLPTQSSVLQPRSVAPVDATAPGMTQPSQGALLSVVVPVPTEEYIKQSQPPPRKLAKRQPLLIILDLNGTLIHRKSRKFPPSYAKRPELEEFLKRLMRKHRVMVWSSSQPKTVDAICSGIFPNGKRTGLAAVWARDKLGLTKQQYTEKVQVYKQLEKVWADESIQARYPTKLRAETGRGWDQSNTVLIDDSKLKAAGQPFNILEIPEFTNDPALDDSHVLHNVWVRIHELAMVDDVSRLIRAWESHAVPIITRANRLPESGGDLSSDSSDLVSERELTVAEARRKRMKDRKKAARKEQKAARRELKAAKRLAKEEAHQGVAAPIPATVLS